ncbi:MAG: 2-phosphosulfolactate phosphatase [Acidimicrobiales bacterium]
MVPGWTDQGSYDVRFEWGPTGVEAVPAEIVVVIDVLRFTTAVDAAVSRGVAVHPHRWRDDSAATVAANLGAELADGSAGRPSLSPTSLLALSPGTRVVLPSPNGSTCAVMADEAGATVVAACLRNAAAVACWLNESGASVSVIACGERWHDGTLRPALEDLLGAGAVIAGLIGRRSPEAQAAAVAWLDTRDRIAELLAACSSGREMVERDWADDLAYALEVDVSETVPVLRDGAFVDARG